MCRGTGVGAVRPDASRDRAAAIAIAALIAAALAARLPANAVAIHPRVALGASCVPIVIMAAAVAVVLACVRWLVVRRVVRGRVSIEVIPGEQFEPSPEAIERFASQLARVRRAGGWLTGPASAVRVLIACDRDGVVRYVLQAPHGSRATLEAALAAYADVELRDHPAVEAASSPGRVVRVRLVLARSADRPLAEIGLEPDLLEGIAAAIDRLNTDAGEHAALALDVGPMPAGRAARTRRRLVRHAARKQAGAGRVLAAPGRSGRLAPSQTVERRHDTRALDRKLAPGQTLLRFQLRVCVRARSRSRAIAVMRALLSCLDALGAENHLRAAGLRLGGLGFLGSDLRWRRRGFDRRLRDGWFSPRARDVVTAAELRGLLKPPTVHCHADNVARGAGEIPAPPLGLIDYRGQPDVIPLGRVRSRIGERVVGVRGADTFFAYMAGRSRYGKTETAIGQFIALVRSGAGGLFLDPHADAIAEIKAYLTDPGVRDRVVEIDLSDRHTDQRQAAWNLFALTQRTPTEAAARVEAFVDALAAALRWDERNTRALNLATQAAQALTELALALPAELAPTIFQVPTLLSDHEWRAAAMPRVSAGTRGFFDDRFPSLPAEAATAVTNLIDRLRASRPAAALLGTPISTYDARRAMREDLIVLACPGSGSTRDRVLANLLVYDVLHAAKARATLPAGARRPFWVFLDELQTYDGPNLPALLEQSAKYGGRAFLFNQNPERLTAATWNAVSTNRSHLLSTTVNAKAARMISAEWGTPPAPEALTRLDRYTYLASVTHGTQVSRPFLVHGIPARDLHANHHHPDQIVELEAAIDRTAQRRAVTEALAHLDAHDERILRWLKQHPAPAAGRGPDGPHRIRLTPEPGA
jgi:hypothetical protein